MNDKVLFYLFFKYSDIVISRYRELTSPPVQYVSTPQKAREDFENVLQSSKEFIDGEIRSSGRSDNGYRYNFPNYYFYFGKKGWDKYGVFSLISLYKLAKWNISVIEKYKDSIVWPMLFEYGDYMFEEETLKKYEQYIPWADYSQEEKRYIPFFDNGVTVKLGTTLSNFKNVGTLSYAFIKSHISVIDILGLCSTGSFEVTKELIKMFCDNCSENLIFDYRGDRAGLTKNERITISSDVLMYIAKNLKISNWEKLLPKINLTHENFLEFYLYDRQCMEIFFALEFDKRREIVSLIEQKEELRQVLVTDYVKQLWQGGRSDALYTKSNLYFRSGGIAILNQEYCEKEGFEGLKNLPYTYDFSVQLIKKNISSWNKQSYEYFSRMKRTPDTNYHYYRRVTAWDILSKQESILLTYDLCKYLMSIDVFVGGSYVLEDGHFHSDDKPNYPINALKLFRFRDILNDDEFIKITQDENIIEFLFANADPPIWRDYYVAGNIIDKLIMNFFKDFSFEKFKEIIVKNRS